MSSDMPAPPIGHNRAPGDAEEQAALIEQVAADLWVSRDDRRWEDAGEHWQRIFRELATTAVASVRRHDDAHI